MIVKGEVKGTTAEGAEVVLTRNEVKLHRAEHPNNALGVAASNRSRTAAMASRSDTAPYPYIEH